MNRLLFPEEDDHPTKENSPTHLNGYIMIDTWMFDTSPVYRVHDWLDRECFETFNINTASNGAHQMKKRFGAGGIFWTTSQTDTPT